MEEPFGVRMDSPIFHYWVKEIFCAMKDLLEQCTYVPKKDIDLRNLFVWNEGLK